MRPLRLFSIAVASAALTLMSVAAMSTPADAYGRHYRSYGHSAGFYGHRFGHSYYRYGRFSRHATFGGYRYGHLRGGLGISLRSGR